MNNIELSPIDNPILIRYNPTPVKPNSLKYMQMAERGERSKKDAKILSFNEVMTQVFTQNNLRGK